MKAVATIGACGLSIVNKPLQYRLKDEVKIAFDNATGNEIFFRKYKVEKFEGRVRCLVKKCEGNFIDIIGLHKHCLSKHGILLIIRDQSILHMELTQRKIYVSDMSSEDAGSIKNSPEAISISNNRIKTTGIIGESSFSKDNNDLQYRLKDEVISAFKNYIADNSYGGKYQISIVDNKLECIIKGCDRRYKYTSALYNHCISNHNIRIVLTGKNIIAIEKVEPRESLCCICSRSIKYIKALRDHYSKVHDLKSKLNKDGILEPIIQTSNELSKIDEPDTDKVQDNTNATKSTTDNMDSNRKRSHATAIHEEESNAKKASLNTSKSGYPKSDSASENIDDEELLELARELAQNNNDFKYALYKDVADKYATSRDSY